MFVGEPGTYGPLAYEKAKVGEGHAGLIRERGDERLLVLGRLLRGTDDQVPGRAAATCKWERPRPAHIPEPNRSTGRTEPRELGLETGVRADARRQGVN